MTEKENEVLDKVEEGGEEGGEETTITVPKNEYDTLVEERADAIQSKTNLVDEIKDLRKTKQDAEAEAELAKEKLEANKGKGEDDGKGEDGNKLNVSDVATEAVKKVLDARREEDAQSNKETALELFKETYKEFHPENDEGGLKFSAFEKTLIRFNFDGAHSEKDFTSIFGDAYKLLVREDKKTDDRRNDFSSSPSEDSSSPRTVSENTLTNMEIDLIDRVYGGDREKYLKAKAKRPEYFEQLLKYAK